MSLRARERRVRSKGRAGVRQTAPGLSVSTLLGIPLVPEVQGRAYTAYPNLREVRWLLPTDRPVLRQAGIRGLYQPTSLRGRALKRLVDAGALRGEKVWLEESALATLEAAMARACLLYTSPSPRDRTRSRMPSSA